MQSKAYAKASGVPTTWSQEDQGYIARWYSYYSAETCCKNEDIGTAVRKILLTIFILLNLIVLHATITHGVSWYYRLHEILNERSQQTPWIYLEIALPVFNLLYLIVTVWVYVKQDIPPIHLPKCSGTSEAHCIPSHNSSIYKDELVAFTAKLSVMLIAIITELMVAIKAPQKIGMLTARWHHHTKCQRVVQIILLWNTFVFLQISMGLICLPVCIFLLITPLQTISVLCAAVATFAITGATTMIILQLGNQCYARTCKFGRDCGHFLWYLILVALVAAVCTFYFYLLPQGTSISSTRGVIFSLIPPIAISMTSWMVKRKFLSKDSTKKNKVKVDERSSISSVLTEEEDSAVEQDIGQDNLMRSDESGVERSDSNIEGSDNHNA